MPKALEIHFSPRAQTDIHNIYDYTEENWGHAQAKAYTLDLKLACQRLAEMPKAGRSVGNIRRGYYAVNCGSHNIFFREEKNRIVVIRILHERMDFKLHL